MPASMPCGVEAGSVLTVSRASLSAPYGAASHAMDMVPHPDLSMPDKAKENCFNLTYWIKTGL
jgi:hypothetical protein